MIDLLESARAWRGADSKLEPWSRDRGSMGIYVTTLSPGASNVLHDDRLPGWANLLY